MNRAGHCCNRLSDAECASTPNRHCSGWVGDLPAEPAAEVQTVSTDGPYLEEQPPPEDFSERMGELRGKVGAK